ncbi:MAG TPA: HEPN domain-containing protein [Actinomycetota bacterium]|nr:HEPN domain-containing protein [Actinomycetota bacterium]
MTKVVDDSEISDDLFGFHVQQAVEKYVKAVLAVQQSRPKQTHDLAALLEEVRDQGIDVPDEVLAAAAWTPYAVRNRYPFLGAAPSIDRRAAIELVRAVREWAEAEVGD